MQRGKLSYRFLIALIAGAILLSMGAVFGLPVWSEYSLSRQDTASLLNQREARQNDEQFLAHLGKRLNSEQRFSEALPLLERAVGLAPGKGDLRDEWAKAQMGAGHVTEAYDNYGNSLPLIQMPLLRRSFWGSSILLSNLTRKRDRNWKRRWCGTRRMGKHGRLWRTAESKWEITGERKRR